MTELQKHTILLGRIATVLETAAQDHQAHQSTEPTDVPDILPLSFDGLAALDAPETD